MIVYFTVRNFKSFKDEQTLYMTPVGKVKGLEENLLTIDSEYNIVKESKNKLLKVAAISGQNASGKSNFIEAMRFMKDMVENSFEKMNNKHPIKRLNSFMYSEKEESTFFEISFIMNKINYIYSFEITLNGVLNEKLLKNDKGVKKLFFERIGDEVHLGNKKYINSENIKIAKKTLEKRKEVLLMTFLNFLDTSELDNIFDYFYSYLNIQSETTNYLKAIATKINEAEVIEDVFNLMKVFIKSLDVRIDDIELSDDLSQKYPFIAIHRNKLRDGTEVEKKIPFAQESEGTKKLLKTAYLIISSLGLREYIFIVDELDDKIHTNLFIEIIKLYQCSRSQFIFATHNPYILEQNLLRNDQIYFVDKNEYEESELYSLSDFKGLRKDYSNQKRYLNGNFGAVPIIDFNELKEKLYLNGERNG